MILYKKESYDFFLYNTKGDLDFEFSENAILF